ncbi:PP2C family protein-serine/threonine phosphatase [Angustibacter aerolatus]
MDENARDGDGPLGDLLEASHLAAPHLLPRLVARCAEALGAAGALIFLADLQQQTLVPFSDPDGPDADKHPTALSIDSTMAGRAFQLVRVHTQRADPPRAARVWLPLLNGSERLGVLEVEVHALEDVERDDSLLVTRLRRLASLTAELVTAKTPYGDTIVQLRRQQRMGLAAEIQWGLLPPLTFVDGNVAIAGVLEPAYEVAGDTFDYSVDPGRVHVALFDAMGHGLASAQLVSLAVASYRNGRRAGRTMTDIARATDAVLTQTLGEVGFATALLMELDTQTGQLLWVNAGHPKPLLLRGGKQVKALHARITPPLGLGWTQNEPLISIGTETLEPGDRVLLYTDGAIEARSPEGRFFGVDHLADLLLRHLADGMPAPETMRRVVNALLEHHDDQLSDDATLLLLEWRTGNEDAVRS